MTTLKDRPGTALLVVDLQQGVLEGAHRRDEILTNIGAAVAKARGAGTTIIWVKNHEGGELIEGPQEGEPTVGKRYPDAFEESTLEAELSARSIGRLFVAGAETDECIRATLHGAIVRGYDAMLISDAHTTGDHTEWGAPPPDAVIAHTNLYWTDHQAPGRTAGTTTTAELAF
jgi:nicotinamidase-related amidase